MDITNHSRIHMRKIFTLFLSLPLLAAAQQQDVTLYGQLYTGSDDNSVYSFSSGETSGMEKVAEIAAVPNCGSVKTDDRFYCFSKEAGDYGAEYRVYVYDITDGYTLVTSIGSAYSIAKEGQVLAYDPVSKKIYSVFEESSYYGSEYYLGEVNISNRTMTKIGSSLYFGYGSTSIVAMAFDKDGELYAIASNSYLYKIDTSDASLTRVGDTGLYPLYEQSMTFSPDGSTIYWAACNDDVSALYKVDPANGSAVKVKDFPDGEEFVSLWAGDVEAAPGAPAAPTDLEAEFPEGSLAGKLVFTAPLLTHGGDALEGEISYTVTSDGETLATGTTAPGEKTECGLTVTKAGLYEFKVSLSNDCGTGDNAVLPAIYVGPDAPRYVENLALARGDEEGDFIVTWDAPSSGAHGGYVDLSTVKYRVRRLPSLDVISEDAVSPFHDTFLSDEPVKCGYEVTPYVDSEIAGLPLTTHSVMTGTPFEVPYQETFETVSAANRWTVVDSNNDGHSWEYQWDFGYFRVYDNENPKDDWLISPYVRLEAGYRYSLTFKVRTIATEQLEVKMGLGLEPEDMTVTLHELETIPDTDYSWQDRECQFDAPGDGRFHFGFHAATQNATDGLAAYVDDVKVEKIGQSGVEAVAVTAADAPVMVSGALLTALRATGVEIFTPDGRLLRRATLRAGETLTLQPGVQVIVADGSHAVKVMVK